LVGASGYTEPVDLNDLISDAQEALKQTQEEYERHRLELKALDERMSRLNAEVQGLQLARTRREGPVAEEFPADPAEDVWRSLSRLKAIVRVLAESDGPRSPSVISRLLEERGREGDLPYLVSAALANLKRAKRVEQAGYGLWTIPGKVDTEQPEGVDES